MNQEPQTYLASDLAQLLEVPRSTVNDWLARYGDYLEIETRGKRKAYSERSLAVLREVSRLRNEGKTSFDIEQFLIASHGIRPEVAPPEEVKEEAPPAPEAAPLPSAESLPALRPAFDEMSTRFVTEFHSLAEKFEALERERRRMLRRMWSFTLAGIGLLLVAVAGTGVALHLTYARSEKRAAAENKRLADQLTNLEAGRKNDAAESSRQAGELTHLLDRARGDFDANLKQLQTQLAEQRRAFTEKLARLEKNAATRAEAEALRLKEEFARGKRLELEKLAAEYEAKLKEVQAGAARLESSAGESRTELQKSRAELDELRARIAELEQLRREVKAAEKEIAPPAPVTTEEQP